MKWGDLSLSERSDLMGFFLDNGVSSIKEMRHIYDGTEDNVPMEVDENGNLIDSISPAVVSESLSRDEWNDLYRQGKVSLSDIPRKYQSYIQGDPRNSGMYKLITDTTNKIAQRYILPVLLGGTAGPVGMAAGLANTGLDMAISYATKGERDSWGDLLADREQHPVLSSLLEFTNPLNFITGSISTQPKLTSLKGLSKTLGTYLTPRELRKDKNLMRLFPDFSTWSKSGEKVPQYLVDEYADIYRRLRKEGIDVIAEAEKKGIAPQAYLQMKSENYKKFLDYYKGEPNIEYHGSMFHDAYEFPPPSSKKYKGKTPGTATGNEGIYTSSDKEYAARYTRPIGLYSFAPKPSWYKGGRNYIVTVGVNPIDQLDSRMGSFPANYMQKLKTETKNYIESLGYNGIRGISGFGDYPETVVFSPSQIKSLEGNIGYFDPLNDNIFKKYGGGLNKRLRK